MADSVILHMAFQWVYSVLFLTVSTTTLFIYGRKVVRSRTRMLNDTWEWVDAPLTLHVLPGVGHGPHTQVPEIVTPRMMEWLETG